MMKFGDRIAQLRTRHKLTQAELAEKIGITRASLSHYEKNRREPDYETLKRIADFFDVSTDYILGREKKDVETIAAHHDDYDWSQEELEEIERFKEFVRNKRNQ
nr:helix-turn-helix transcriptional regulator [Shouchella clausii]